MNLSKLFKTLFVLLLFVGAVSAQTFYVNNQTGDDANAGTLASPKKTVGSALIAAPSGSTISVAPTGINYTEGNITISGKTYTFTTTTAGTPNFVNANFSVGSNGPLTTVAGISAANPAVVTTAAPHGLVTGDVVYLSGTGEAGVNAQYWTVTVLTGTTFSIAYNNAVADGAGGNIYTRGIATFTGTFTFQDLNLRQGSIAGANNLTIAGGDVYRTELGSVTGQMVYPGLTNFVYENITTAAGVNITTGPEFPTATNRANALTTNATAGNVTLVLDQDRTINNLMQLGTGANNGGANLGGFTLNIVGGTLAHTTDGDITNGTLAFNINAAAATPSINGIVGGYDLPNVTTTSASAGAPTLTIGVNITDVDNITASGTSEIAANNVGDIDDVTLNGSGTIVTTNDGNVNAVLGAAGSTGTITLNKAGVAGTSTATSITQTGNGLIQYGANINNISVTGNVLLNTVFTLNNTAPLAAVGPLSRIIFSDDPTTVGGSVTNDVTIDGPTDDANTTLGVISFLAADNDVTLGAVVNNAKGTASLGLAGGTLTASGNILFAYTGATATSDFTAASFTNSSTLSGAAFNTNSGMIQFTAATNGNGQIDIAGAVTNSSSTTTASASVGIVDFGVTGAAVLNLGSVTSNGAVGGDIQFGVGDVTLTGSMTNSRSSAGADILFGAGTATFDFTVGGNLVNSGSSNIDVTATTTNPVNVTGQLQVTGTGRIEFINATTATFAFNGTTLSNGALRIRGTGNIVSGDDNATSLTNGTLDIGTGVAGFAISGGIAAANPAVIPVAGHTFIVGDVVYITGNADPGINGTWTVTAVAAGVSITIGYNSPGSAAGGTVTLTRNFNVSSSDVTIGGATTNPTFTSALGNLRFVEAIPNVTQVIKIGGADPTYPGMVGVVNGANIVAPIVVFQPATVGTPGNLYVTNNVLFNTALVNNSIRLDDVRLNVGKNGIGGGNGHFQNTTGYTTLNSGRVLMSGLTAQQVVNYTAAAAAVRFGNFGVDNERDPLPLDGVAEVVFSTPCVFNGDFYLAEGDVSNVNVTFNGVAPWGTIFRTEGMFIAAPTIFAGTKVNVTYYGGDKTTSFEVPAAGFLNDLTVATTNGAVPGQGVVTLGGGTQVDGTLTINSLQNLYTAGNNLFLNGASAVINGNLVDNGGTEVFLMAAGGTAFSGTGSMPTLQVQNGSMNNTLTGIPGLVSDAFGADNALGGGDDAFATYDGNIIYQAGADTGSLFTVSFTTAGPHFAALNMQGADQDQTFAIGANTRISGNMTIAAGTLSLGDFTFTHSGTAPGMTGGASITSNAAGKLLFNVNTTNFTVTAPAAIIGANVEVNLDGNNTFALAAGSNLTINGTLTLVDAGVAAGGAVFDITAGRTLTAGGNVTVGTNCSFTASGAGTGILLLDAVAPPLTYTTNAATTVANLTVADDVVLAGGVLGSTLTINGNHAGVEFNHTAGDFNIGTANLVVGTGASATDYTRTGGTYSGTGFFVWNSAGVFTHGPALVLNNLRTTTNLTLISATGVTVNDYLDLDGGVLDHTIAGVGYLTIGDGGTTTVEVDGTGNLAATVNDVAATFAAGGVFNYLFSNASSVPNLFTWPTNQANNVTVNLAGAGNTVSVNNSRSIAGDLDITLGDFVWDGGIDILFPNAASTIIRRENGSVLNNNGLALAGTGTLTVTPSINLAYQNANVNINTDLEYTLPAAINNFTLLPISPNNNTLVTIDDAGRTIQGTLTLNSVLNINANTTFTLDQTVPAGSQVDINSGVAVVVTVNWNGNLVVNGTYRNDVTPVAQVVTTNVVGVLSGTGAITNNDVFTLGGMNLTGASNLILANASTTTLTGDATIAGFTPPAFAAGIPAEAGATISTNSSLTFGTAAWTGAGNLLNLTFTGTNAQAVALGANRQINNLNMTKGGDQTVTFSGGNLTLNPLQDNGNQPAGVLTLTRGILVMADPTLLTLQLTTNVGGVITNLGYVRNLAQATDFAHVVGRLGVFIPAGTIGRSEWPVGSINPHYRPAAITFTAGNATIAPTTIIVSHLDSEPAGTKNFPINGGTKFADPSRTNWIGGKAPYHWSFEATTSLGAAQLMNVELNGTNLNKPLDNHNDLRIIRRFDGDVTVNGWFLEGGAGSYSNAMYINTPAPGDTLLLVRNIGSIGSAIAQRALFTIGIPSGAPIFTATAPAAVTVPENTLYTFDFDATDQDVNVPAPNYGLVNPPAGATINATTGVFTWTPGFDQGSITPYNVTVRAYKGNDNSVYTDYTFAVTVTNVNRAPSFTGTGTATVATGNVISGDTFPFTYAAVDADGEDLTYAIQSITPAFAGTATISPTLGEFAFTPDFADAGQTFTVTISATDPSAAVATTTTDITVGYPVAKGDVDADGDVDIDDAVLVLDHVVGNATLTDPQALWAADINDDALYTAVDASRILYFWAYGSFPTWKLSATAANVEFGQFRSEDGLITLPINITNANGVLTFYAEVDLGTELEFVGVAKAQGEGWISSSKFENGTLRFVMVGNESLKDGAVATVSVRLKDKESAIQINASANLNDENRIELNAINLREIPTEFALRQNYPNPFNPTTTIKYAITENAHVTLVVYDLLGQVVRKLVDNEQEAGFYTLQWDGTSEYGSRVASGIYIYRITAGKYTSTLKMNLLK